MSASEAATRAARTAREIARESNLNEQEYREVYNDLYVFYRTSL